MELNEYQQEAKKTAKRPATPEMALLNWSLGLGGEVGEFQNAVKKWWFHEHGLVSQDMAKELGDILWYLALAADALGFTLEEIAKGNLEKLAKRYPAGFDPQKSRGRNER
ncbi:unnamed protein product [marine sediment metagenome]|uniref:NTP pyrophosphohydrolase MazG-like domain-containing protein n=1 Tax=marine sediment metagenome TaxID=412755 RepID=X0SCK4_9ZZZZ